MGKVTLESRTIRIVSVAPSKLFRDKFWNKSAEEKIRDLGFSLVFNDDSSSLREEQWAELLEGADGLITTWGSPRLTDAILSQSDTLKIIGHAAGSVAPIVSPAVYRRGIKVISANSVMAEAVAQWSLMATMIGIRRLLYHAQFGNKHPMVWADQDFVCSPQMVAVGIWGFGDISRHLVRYLSSFGFQDIVVCSNHLTDDEAAGYGIRKVDYEQLFAVSDVIHLLAGLTEKNVGKVGRKQLASIKDGSTLINAGRAKLVQREALIEELEKGHFTAILDVHYIEPLQQDSPFRRFPKVILTPHNSGYGGYGLYVKCVLEEFERFFNGQPLRYEINEKRAMSMTDESLVSF